MNADYSLNYQVLGDGPPVVLVHGLGASLRDWNRIASDLASAGYRAYAVDLPGHGYSPKPADWGAYSADEVYAQFSEWLAGLKLTSPPLLVGHSLGGFLALRCALDQPLPLAGIVLIDPFYSKAQLNRLLRFAHGRVRLGEIALRLTPAILLKVVLGLIPGHLSQIPQSDIQQTILDLKQASPRVLYTAQTIPDLTGRLNEVGVRAMVLWGERDRTLHPASFQRLIDLLPDARGIPLPGGYHQPHISHPAWVVEHILSFIRQEGMEEPSPQFFQSRG